MNKPKLTTALSKTKTSNSACAKIKKDTKRSLPTSPTRSPPRKKKGSRNPGTNLSTLEKKSLFEMLDKHHPLHSDRSQGKNIPSAADLFKSTNLKPDVTLGGGSEPCFDDVAFFLVRDGWLNDEDMHSLSQLEPHYEALVTTVPALAKVDFSSLRDDRLDYSTQKEISPERVAKLMACAIHFTFDFGLVVRYINDEHTAKHRDPDKVKQDIGDYIDPADMAHITRILTKGCPAQLQFALPREQKMRMIRHGNQKSILNNQEEIRKTMNKEEKHCHIVPFFPFVCRFANMAQCVPQGMVLRIGSDPRIVWDGSTKIEPNDVVMNDIIPMELEAPTTFGGSKEKYIAHIYNTRASYQNENIDLAAADVKCAHRYPRVAPDLAAAFGFYIQGMYFSITTAVVFGSVASASSWEPFRRAIEVMTRQYSMRTDLVKKHKALLDMVIIEPPAPPGTVFVKAVLCPVVMGVLDRNGDQKQIPNFIYVDDCLLACMRAYTLRLLSACIEAIFVVLGFPNERVRQSHLAMNKWVGTHVGHRVVQIGLIFDSRKLTVSMTPTYIANVLKILNNEWPPGTVDFALKSIVTLAGKLARLGEAAPWVYHLMPQIYASIAFALRANETFLLNENAQFRSLVNKIKSLRLLPKVEQDVEHLNFYVRKAAKRKFKSSLRFDMNETLTEEIEVLRSWLCPTSGISWEAAMAHLFHRTPTFKSLGDSSCGGGGGFSIKLRFWWHLS